MNDIQKFTIELIRYEIFNIPVDSNLVAMADDEMIEAVYDFAIKIDMGYIVASALSKLNLLADEAKSAFFSEQLATVYRHEALKYDLESISKLFEEAGIDFIPLKGSVIREYYPKPEMRTSCDVDVLIHKVDLAKARKLLEDKLEYKYNDMCAHDISFWSPTGTEVELHHTLLEHDFEAKEILDKVWHYATPVKEYKHKYELDRAFFMFYHIVHMEKHVRTGGCGVRPLLDLIILEEKFDYDKDAFQKMIADAGLRVFSQKMFDVAHMWFGTMEADEISDLMADYVFGAGAYGSVENRVARTQLKKGSGVKSVLSRIFISRKELGVMYPVVAKHLVLTPLFEVVRWFRIIFKDKAKKQMAIIKHNVTMDKTKIDKVDKLFSNLGLK